MVQGMTESEQIVMSWELLRKQGYDLNELIEDVCSQVSQGVAVDKAMEIYFLEHHGQANTNS